MLQITKEQILQKWDSLPKMLKEALFSDEVENIILQSCEKYHFSNKQTEIVGIMVGDVLLGFLPPSQLTKELIKDGFSADLANSLYKDMDEKIFAPLKNELEQSYKELRPLSQQEKVVGQPLKESGVELDALDEKKEQTTNIQPTETETIKKEDLRIFQPLKPDFLDSRSASSQKTAEKQQVEKSPGGLSPNHKSKQESPEPKTPKIVHYSDLRTPLDEYSQKNIQPATTQNQPQTSIPEKISPENIVDLKDLPL